MGLMGLLMASYGGLWGILNGLTKSTDHPSKALKAQARGAESDQEHLAHQGLLDRGAQTPLWRLFWNMTMVTGLPGIGKLETTILSRGC